MKDLDASWLVIKRSKPGVPGVHYPGSRAFQSMSGPCWQVCYCQKSHNPLGAYCSNVGTECEAGKIGAMPIVLCSCSAEIQDTQLLSRCLRLRCGEAVVQPDAVSLEISGGLLASLPTSRIFDALVTKGFAEIDSSVYQAQ